MTLAITIIATCSVVALVCVLAAARSKSEAESFNEYLSESSSEFGFVRAAELVSLNKQGGLSPALRAQSEGSSPA